MTAEAAGGRSREEQLEWEARVGRFAGAAAVGALLLPAAAQFYFRYAIGLPPRDLVRRLELLGTNGSDLAVVAAMQALSLLLLGAALAFLVVASRYRREATPAGALVVVALGSAVTAAVSVVQLADTLATSAAFLAGPRTPAHAQEVVRASNGTTILQFTLGANLAFGLAMVLTGVSAMRAGLLSRFMGVLGIVVGVLFALGGSRQAFLLFFWSGALALILLDRWPGGRGPAWSTGEAVPWPGAAERRLEQLENQRAGTTEPAGPAGSGEPEAAPRRKRKRKRR